MNTELTATTRTEIPRSKYAIMLDKFRKTTPESITSQPQQSKRQRVNSQEDIQVDPMDTEIKFTLPDFNGGENDQLNIGIFKEGLNAILTPINSMHQEFSKMLTKVGKLEEKTDVIQEELLNLTALVEEQQTEISNLKLQNESFEKFKKQKNIILTGLHITKTDLRERKLEMERFFVQILNVKVNVDNVSSLPNNTVGAPRSLISFQSVHDKMAIFKNTRKLKVFNQNRENLKKVFISEDLSKKEEKRRKILLNEMQQARRDGKRAQVIGKKLFIDEFTFILNKDDELQLIQQQDTPTRSQ